MEAIKNRPEGQRCNSKQIDVIGTDNGTVETWGYPVVAARKHIGVLTTTIVKDKDGNVISTASTWVPGDLTIKAKKGHGIITGVKPKKEKEEERRTKREARKAEREAARHKSEQEQPAEKIIGWWEKIRHKNEKKTESEVKEQMTENIAKDKNESAE